jgi:hypothetical protein
VLGLGPEVDQLARELEALLAGGSTGQLTGFREVRALMENGAPEAPRTDPADRVLAHAKR